MRGTSLSMKHNGRSLLQFAAPTIVMTVFMSLYTTVDGIFVANWVSSQALAGLNLVIPGLSVLVACAVLISAGGSVVIARKLGQGQNQEARADFSSLVFGTVLFGLVVTVLGTVFASPILGLLGTTPALFPVAYDYYQTLVLFSTSCVLQVQFQYFFIAAGLPRLGLFCVTAGGITNIVLDYGFIVLLDLGIRGAALATGIGYSIPAAVGLIWFSVRRDGVLFFSRPAARASTWLESCVNGASSMIINLAGALVTWLFNRIIVLYLGEAGISAATIVLYARFVFNSILSGYASGVSPVISYNFGRQDFDQVKLLFRVSVKVVMAGSLLSLAACALLSEPVSVLFASDDPYLAQLARRGILLFSLGYLFNGINTFAAALFSALNKGSLSAVMSFLHTFVFLTGAMLLLPRFGLGADGVWLAVPAAELCSLFLSIYLLKRNQKIYRY